MLEQSKAIDIYYEVFKFPPSSPILNRRWVIENAGEYCKNTSFYEG